MRQVDSITGQDLREMLATATNWLEKSASDVDALNVFPVPDGDTGTNMLLTMRSGIEEAYQVRGTAVAEISQALARGTLMGARGNSGVILSQIWNGLAKGLKDSKLISGGSLAVALTEASATAYRGISNPVEGTILTVIREAAEAGRAQLESGKDDVLSVMEAVVNAANESVANTPALLPVLREAGVVDAGGQGLYTILEGALRYLRGESEQMQFRKPRMIASNLPQPVRLSVKLARTQDVEEVPYGYCTEFLLKGEDMNIEKIRSRLKKKGESLIVVGDETTARVHIHTLDPGNVIRYATTLGTMHQVSIRNMDEQHQDFLEMRKERMPEVDIATVAVVSGDGLADVFSSLGATAIVSGGQTMNPSTKDLLQAVKAVASDKVIILPNNKNIILTAEQVRSLTDKQIAVVPTKTMPQGVAALLTFDYEADFEANARIMAEATATVRTIEITRAVRAAQLDGLKIEKNQAIGLLDGELLATGADSMDILDKMLVKLDLKNSEIITIYYGADTGPEDVEKVSVGIKERYPQLQVETIRGGQPYYSYIVSIE